MMYDPNNIDPIISDLVQWELNAESQTDLENFFFTKMVFYYENNPIALADMLQYKKECTDTEIYLTTVEEFREIARQQDNGDVELHK